MRRSILFAGVGAAALLNVALAGSGLADDKAEAEVRAALESWRTDFNTGRADKVCDLFAPDLVADIRDLPERRYEAFCDNLKRSVTDPARSFHYDVDVKEVIVAGDLAVVRLTWTLTIAAEDGGGAIQSVEEGMDVFRRESDGKWRIFRFMTYEVSS